VISAKRHHQGSCRLALRQSHRDLRAYSDRALNSDCTVRAVDDGLADGEAESCSAAIAAARTIGAVEAIEDMGKRGLRDTFASVHDSQLGHCVSRVHGNGDTPLRRAMLQGSPDPVGAENLRILGL